MSEIPLHPVAVHMPIALSLLMPVAIGGFAIAWARGAVTKKALVLVLALQAFLVASGVVGIRTGELEEERIGRAVSHEALEHHEHDAKRFVLSAFVVLVVLAGGSVVKRDSVSRGIVVVGAVVSVVSAFMALDAGHHGGELVYEHGAAQVRTPPAP